MNKTVRILNGYSGGAISPTITARYGQRGKLCVLREDGYAVVAVAEFYEED